MANPRKAPRPGKAKSLTQFEKLSNRHKQLQAEYDETANLIYAGRMPREAGAKLLKSLDKRIEKVMEALGKEADRYAAAVKTAPLGTSRLDRRFL